MAISPIRKYEKEGGPSLIDSIRIIQDISTEPAPDIDQFIDWVIFNLICGNSDAHGKNLSIVYTEDGARLAPFYDLVSTTIYKNIDKNMAMSIGGKTDPGQIGKKEWESFSKAIKVGSPFLLKKVKNKIEVIVEASDKSWDSFIRNYGEIEFINQIRLNIHRQARRCSNLL